MEMMYPELIVYSIIGAFIILFVWRKRKKFKNGIIVANTKYVKKTRYYKSLMLKYRIYNILIKAVCVLLIITCAILTARIYKTDKEEKEEYNRDIMLCMDVSGSVWDLDSEIIDTFIDLVSKLKDERFGLSAFNSSPVNIIPLTSDYNYAITILKELKKSFEPWNKATKIYRSDRITVFDPNADVPIINAFEGAFDGDGSSLIGEGLAYCASTFKKDDDRTKIVILTTDDEVQGSQIISVPEAANYSKSVNVKVYPIGTKAIKSAQRQELIEVANITNGNYYDFNAVSTSDIVDRIQKLNKTAIVKNVAVTKKDLPEIIVPYLFYILPALFVLEWRVRI